MGFRFHPAALLVPLLLFSGSCGGGGGGGGKGRATRTTLDLSELQAPAVLYAGQPARFSFRILSRTARRRVEVSLELVPLDAGGLASAVLDPRDPSYESIRTGGMTVESLDRGEERGVANDFLIEDELPTGSYAAVLRADAADWFGRGDRPPPRNGVGSPGAPFVVATHPVEIVAPDLLDLRVESVVPDPTAFRAAASGGVGPEVDGPPETGDVEREGDLSAAVVLAASFRPAVGPVKVGFELGVPGVGGAPPAWYALDVIDRTAPGNGTVTVPEQVLPPLAGSPNALEAGESRGFTANLVLPGPARDDLLSREADAVCTLRVTVDPDDDFPEWNEGSPGSDNVLEVPVVHLGPAGPDDPADSVTGPDQILAAAERRPEGLTPAILKGDRLDGRSRYPLLAAGFEKEDRFGSSSTMAISYRLGTTFSYSPSINSAIPSGRRVALQIPSQGASFLRAVNGGGAGSSYGSSVGSWELMTLEMLSRAGSDYQVRLRAGDGTHVLGVDGATYPRTTYRQVHFRFDAAAADVVFGLTDGNGGELASGDPVTLQWGAFPVVALGGGLGSGTGAAASPMILLDADPASPARKAKFITDNRVDFGVFKHQFSLLKVAAAAEFDSEDVARTYFDWEVLVVGAKLWGSFIGAEAKGDDLVVATLWDSAVKASGTRTAGTGVEDGPAAVRASMPKPAPEPPPPTKATDPSKYTKHEEQKAHSYLWIGPVPLTISAGGQGSLGVRGAVWIGANNRIVAEAGPALSYAAFASAGVELFGTGASLRGELTLLRVGAIFRSSIQIAVGDTTAALTISAPLTLSTMDGRIYVRVTWRIPLIFAVISGSQDFDIASWSGWTKTWDLFPPKTWSW